jgi:hypothetical protein
MWLLLKCLYSWKKTIYWRTHGGKVCNEASPYVRFVGSDTLLSGQSVIKKCCKYLIQLNHRHMKDEVCRKIIYTFTKIKAILISN